MKAATEGPAPAPADDDRRRLLRGAAVAGLACIGGSAVSAPASGAPRWRSAFTAPMHEPIDDDPVYGASALRFADVSLRQFVPLALTGSRLRLRISNEFGDAPLQIAAAGAAWRAGRRGAVIVPDSARTASFAGRRSASVLPGRTLLSDPIELPPSAAGADLAVSLYMRHRTPRASWHLVGSRSSYRSAPGNHVAAVDLPVAAQDRSLYFLSAVEVLAPAGAALWVAFGDSITDGSGQTADTDASWPSLWNAAWAARRRGGRPVGVLNAGISGNRLLASLQGVNGLGRFRRDVLQWPGVTGVVLLIGINDLSTVTPDGGPAMVERLVAGQTELAHRARRQGLKVVGGTLTPVGGSVYGRSEVDAGRQRLNQWIRESRVFDAVVDFDAAVRDPADPARFRQGSSVDGLHPNDTGYRAMADAVVQGLDRAGLAPRPA